jgi:FlaA1/EpsC-like NDP-sugar epimerase
MSIKYLPRWLVLFIDIVICTLSCVLARNLSAKFLEVTSDSLFFNSFLICLLTIIVGQSIFFWIFHTYSGVLRYSNFVDAAKLLLAICANMIFLTLVDRILRDSIGEYLISAPSILFYGVISFLLLFIERLLVKTCFDYIIQNSGRLTPVMIYGTQSAAIGIAKMIRSSQELNYKLIGFIDDGNVNGMDITGVQVYNMKKEADVKYILRKTKAVIISPLKMKEINPNKDLDIFINNQITIMTSQPMNIWGGNMPSAKQIKTVQIEDLLGRKQIKITTDNIAASIKDKVVLVSGAAGSIGSEIVRQVVSYKPHTIILVDQAETPMHELELDMKAEYKDMQFIVFLGDVRNQKRMEQAMATYRPDIIYHAAAYKHVPMMENNPAESIHVNVKGTKILADLAVKYRVKRFVMISTDKAVNPTNVMGASKRIAEIYVQSLFKKLQKKNPDTTKFITTRFGNVLGSNGSVIPFFKKQISRGGPVTVTHPDIIRFFMTIPEACTLVLEAGAMGNGGEIYIFDMGEAIKIVDLAKKMIRLEGLTPHVDIDIEFTGLRPGEKLYEELLNNKEITHETHNPKIMIASVQEYDYDEISDEINELIELSISCKDYSAVSQMKKIIPEFKSRNSTFERLDKE